MLQSRKTRTSFFLLFGGWDVLENKNRFMSCSFSLSSFLFFLLHSNWVMLVFVSLHKLTFRSIVLLLACLSSVRCRTKQCNYMLSLSCYGYHHYRSDRCIDSFSQKWHTPFISFLFSVYFVSSSHVRLSIDCSRKKREWKKKECGTK